MGAVQLMGVLLEARFRKRGDPFTACTLAGAAPDVTCTKAPTVQAIPGFFPGASVDGRSLGAQVCGGRDSGVSSRRDGDGLRKNHNTASAPGYNTWRMRRVAGDDRAWRELQARTWERAYGINALLLRPHAGKGRRSPRSGA